MINSNEIIESLDLIPHEEGGFYRQTFETELTCSISDRDRPLVNSIYYLLTKDSPIGYFHLNTSSIMHYFHIGGPLVYMLISPEGEYSEHILGADIEGGHSFQLLVPGGYLESMLP